MNTTCPTWGPQHTFRKACSPQFQCENGYLKNLNCKNPSGIGFKQASFNYQQCLDENGQIVVSDEARVVCMKPPTTTKTTTAPPFGGMSPGKLFGIIAGCVVGFVGLVILYLKVSTWWREYSVARPGGDIGTKCNLDFQCLPALSCIQGQCARPPK